MTRSAAGTDKVEPREHRNGKFEREGVTQLDRNQSRQSKVVGEGLVQKDRRSRDNWGIFWMGSFVVFGIAIIIAAIIHFRVPILFWPIFFGLLATCAEILAKKLISEERLNVHERRLLVWSNRLDIVQQRFIGSNSRGIKYATIFLLLASITMVTLFSLAAFLLMRSGDLSFGVAGVVILLAFLVIFILLKSFRN